MFMETQCLQGPLIILLHRECLFTRRVRGIRLVITGTAIFKREPV